MTDLEREDVVIYSLLRCEAGRQHFFEVAKPRVIVAVAVRLRARACDVCVCVCARVCARACVRRVCADLQVLDGPVDMCFDALGDEHALVHDPDLHMTMFIEAHEKNCQAHEKLFQKRSTAWGNVSPLRVATSRSSRHRTLRGIAFFESGKMLLVKAPPKMSALKSATTRFVTIFSQAMTILVYSLRRLFKL